MIKTEIRYYYGLDGLTIELFRLPPFSEVKKVYIIDNTINLIYQFPDEMEYHCDKKSINLKVQKSTIPINEILYQYFDSQIVTKTDLISSISNGDSLQLNIVNTNNTYHFFIQEIKPLFEQRDNKLNDIIND